MDRHWLAIAFLISFLQICHSQDECAAGGCYPVTGDLLVGREHRIKTTSTCGLEGREKYCIVSFLDKNAKCFYCQSTPEVDARPNGYIHSHLPKYMVTRVPEKRLESWWQAENGVQDVTIEIDLEAEFVFTHLIMTFKTFRPKAMYIERSYNYGKNYTAYRYFAYDCDRSFPDIDKGPQRRIGQIICDERFSKVEPSTKGEVVMKVVDSEVLGDLDPYSLEVQQLLKLTNLRIRIKELHTFGDDVIGNSLGLNQKYYHSIYEIVVRGSCSCYGHAEHCIPAKDTPSNINMVHGVCNCTHNTMGKNCEQCIDGYNDVPWQPSYKNKYFECRKCNCNSHSKKCRFDSAVYAATGQRSGGVCLECEHNTHGQNCEQCKPLYYRDPFKNIFDTDVCKPCDCDPSGSIGQGECETVTDPGNMGAGGLMGTVAGRCICKKNVEGTRCDRCKNGFWNLLESKTEGCQSCNCDARGTVLLSMCDQVTGTCRCKRNVQGHTCSKCVEGYWSLSNSKEGCQSCQCDIGGAVNQVCDDVSGNCKCRPNIIGRQCDKVRPGHYVKDLDGNKYEAENAIGKGVYFRKIKVIGGEGGHTGTGVVEVSDGTEISLGGITVPQTGKYSVFIRYNATNHGDWSSVDVTFRRSDGESLNGDDCEPNQSAEEFYYPTLSRNKGAEAIVADVCFVKGVDYELDVKFNNNDGGSGKTIIDSFIVIPNIDELDLLNTRENADKKDAWDRNNCLEYYLEVDRLLLLPEICKEIAFSITTQINNGASPCNCDPTGTISLGSKETLTCDGIGGQCPCKPGVDGRKCDRCKAGHFGFGHDGCKACDCDVDGSENGFCDLTTGQCPCLPNLVERTCDSCPKYHYGFPDCQACQCNGHSPTCDPVSGVCTDCLHRTSGKNCERCKEGYYGDALSGLENVCRQCQCPGGSSGNQFSNTCYENQLDVVVCDNCADGYEGNQCEKCTDGYHGNPLVPGGTCAKCECNGNIDPFADNKCDTKTGNCNNCINNAEGDHCERCREGFFGNAANQSCQACVCNSLGTSSEGVCDRTTGQCPCLPNVVGTECDQCAPGFYELASGEGCKACSCNTNGSLDATCNQLDGQCMCKVGYGGRDCSECEDSSWGTPTEQCQPCGCSAAGALNQQCDRATGVCQCKPNVVGVKCDQCAPRTSQMLPECQDCHTCNNQWEDIINELEKKVDKLSKIKHGNKTLNASEIATYTKEMEALEKKLKEVEGLFGSRLLSEREVDDLRARYVPLVERLATVAKAHPDVRVQTDDVAGRVEKDNVELDELAARIADLEAKAGDFKDNVTDSMESNLAGALNSTRESLRRSREAQAKVNETSTAIKESKKARKAIKKEFTQPKDNRSFAEIDSENHELLDNISMGGEDLRGLVAELNAYLCGFNATQQCGCDALGCTECGCGGMKGIAQAALDNAQQALDAINKKKDAANVTVEDLKALRHLAEMVKDSVDQANSSSAQARDKGEEILGDIKKLVQDIRDFLNQTFNHPNASLALAEQTLKLNISLTPDDVKELADKIRQVVENLTDVDRILNESKKDYDLAIALKKEALQAKQYAIAVMNKTQNVLDRLEEAMRLQDTAAKNISAGYDKYNEAMALLKQLEEKVGDVEGELGRASNDADAVEQTRDDVGEKFEENKLRLREAENEVDGAEMLADKVKNDTEMLETKYDGAIEKLDKKANETESLRARVQNLLDNAVAMFKNVEGKLQTIDDLRNKYSVNEKRVKDLAYELRVLEIKSAYSRDKMVELQAWHNYCNPDIKDTPLRNLPAITKRYEAELAAIGYQDENKPEISR